MAASHLCGGNPAQRHWRAVDYCAQLAPTHAESKAFTNIRTFVCAARVIAASDIGAAAIEARLGCGIDREAALPAAVPLEPPAAPTSVTASCTMLACACSNCTT